MNDRDSTIAGPPRPVDIDHPQPGPPRPAPWNLHVAWNIPDVAPDDLGEPGHPLAALVSFHYLRGAVRRRWLRCLLLAVLGLLLGGAYLTLSPVLPTASSTLILAHDGRAEASSAIATDLSLLNTRVVAARTIDALGLSMTPEDLLGSVHNQPTGSTEVLQLTMTAPTAVEAVRRLDAFSTQYLAFRATELSSQSTVRIRGYTDRIAALQSKIEGVNARINALAAGGDTGSAQLDEAISARTKLNDQIDVLQSQAQDTMLQRDAVVLASRVVDPPAVLPSRPLKRAALVVLSGLIAGSALGFVLVVLQAILSDRLWLRVEVATALQTRVLLSVRRLSPPSSAVRVLAHLPGVRGPGRRRAVDRQRMAAALCGAVSARPGRLSLAVVCLGNVNQARFGVAAAAVAMQGRGVRVRIVDLSSSGGVATAIDRLIRIPAGELPEALRPGAETSHGVLPEAVVPDEDDGADGRQVVTLGLADLDPAVGLDHLRAWTDRVVVAMTAGASSVELVRTTGDLVRAAGLHLHGALLLGAAPDDKSSWAAPDDKSSGAARYVPDAGGAEAEPGGASEPADERSQRP